MRRRQGVRTGTLLVLFVCGGAGATAQPPSPLSLHVVTSKSMYSMGEPVELKLVLRNTSSEAILTTKGFLAEEAHLRLVFTGPDGSEIRTPPVRPNYEPNALRCVGKRCDGVNVEEIPVMGSGEELVTIVDDASKYYGLARSGHYWVKMVTPFETFSSAVRVESTGGLVSFLSDPKRTVYDPLESNTVSFEILPAAPLGSATVQVTVEPGMEDDVAPVGTVPGAARRLEGLQVRLYRASDIPERFKPLTPQSVARLWVERTPTSSVLTNSLGKANFENLLQDDYVIASQYPGASAMSFLGAMVHDDDAGWLDGAVKLDLKLADEVLKAQLTLFPDPAEFGVPQSVRIAMVNTGHDPIEHVVLAYDILSGVDFITASPQCSFDGQRVMCIAKKIGPGQKTQFLMGIEARRPDAAINTSVQLYSDKLSATSFGEKRGEFEVGATRVASGAINAKSWMSINPRPQNEGVRIVSQFNSTGSPNEVERLQQGRFVLTFTGLGTSTGIVHVSSDNAAQLCNVVSRHVVEANLKVLVDCFDREGRVSEQRFSALFYSQRTATGASAAYALVDQPNLQSSIPVLHQQWNASGATNTATRLAEGRYVVTFPGFGTAGAVVLVTGYGEGAHVCKAIDWKPAQKNTEVAIRCSDLSGQPIDAQFAVSLVGDLNFGKKTQTKIHQEGFVTVDLNKGQPVVTGAQLWGSDSSAIAEVLRESVGEYKVKLAAQTGGSIVAALVSATGDTPIHCAVEKLERADGAAHERATGRSTGEVDGVEIGVKCHSVGIPDRSASSEGDLVRQGNRRADGSEYSSERGEQGNADSGFSLLFVTASSQNSSADSLARQ